MLISRKPSVYFHLFHILLERLLKTVNWVSNVTMSSFYLQAVLKVSTISKVIHAMVRGHVTRE